MKNVPLLLLVGALLAPVAPAQLGTYTAELLGPGVVINDMNASGDVVGWTLDGGVQAYLVGPGRDPTILPLLPGYNSAWAQGINDAGVIVGSTSAGSFPEFGEACSWTPDGQGGFDVALLGALPGHTQSVAYDVNNRGDIIGWSIFPGFQGGPTVWFNSPTGILDLGALGAPSGPKEINDEGVIVGISGPLFDIDTLTAMPLPTFPAGQSGFQGWAINDANGLAGTGFFGSQRAAVSWTAAEGWSTISGVFGQSASVQAFDINASGLTVLEAPTPAAYFPGFGTVTLASLLVPEQQGEWSFFLALGEAVNDAGRIAAMGTEAKTGQSGVVLLTPKATWTDLGGGTAGVNGVPTLGASGTLEAGTSFQIDLDDAAPGAPMLAWLSLSSTPFAALGGTVHAFPFVAQFLRTSDAAGALSEVGTWPAGVPGGTDLFLQFIVQDLSVPAELVLSNAVTATTP